jgi:hypothetical protein
MYASLSRRVASSGLISSEATKQCELLRELGLKEADYVWAQRFGQTGRMTIGEETLRTVTWLSEASGDLTEVHLLASGRYILTVWNGEANALDSSPNGLKSLKRVPFKLPRWFCNCCSGHWTKQRANLM